MFLEIFKWILIKFSELKAKVQYTRDRDRASRGRFGPKLDTRGIRIVSKAKCEDRREEYLWGQIDVLSFSANQVLERTDTLTPFFLATFSNFRFILS